MPSRRKRKRERCKAEATAQKPSVAGGWGQGLPTLLADPVILRQTINQDWPVPESVRIAVTGVLATG